MCLSSVVCSVRGRVIGDFFCDCVSFFPSSVSSRASTDETGAVERRAASREHQPRGGLRPRLEGHTAVRTVEIYGFTARGGNTENSVAH